MSVTADLVLNRHIEVRTGAHTRTSLDGSIDTYGWLSADGLSLIGSPDELYRFAEYVREAARLGSEMHARIEATRTVMQP